MNNIIMLRCETKKQPILAGVLISEEPIKMQKRVTSPGRSVVQRNNFWIACRIGSCKYECEKHTSSLTGEKTFVNLFGNSAFRLIIVDFNWHGGSSIDTRTFSHNFCTTLGQCNNILSKVNAVLRHCETFDDVSLITVKQDSISMS